MAGWLLRRVLFPDRRPQGSEVSEAPNVPRVLVITASTADREIYRSIRERGEWDILLLENVPDALDRLAARQFPIVLCDRDLPGCDWREALARIVERSPRCCFLLTSRVSDEYLWREVVKQGGYDVLAKPLDENIVVQALQRAWYYWKAEQPPSRKPAV